MGSAQITGGKTAAARNKRATSGQFVETPKAQDVASTTTLTLRDDARRYADYFVAPAPSPRLAAVRPFPKISGRKAQLDQAINHLEGMAISQGITVGRIDTHSGDVGWYDGSKRQIMLHGDIHNDPALYAFALAHELGHAFDPTYDKLPEDYSRTLHHGGYEVVAEASAIRSLKSFGLTLENEEEFLTKNTRFGVRAEGWKTGLKCGLFDRYQTCAIPLLKPSLNPELTAARDRAYYRSRKRAYRQVIGTKYRRKKQQSKKAAASRPRGRGRRRRGLF